MPHQLARVLRFLTQRQEHRAKTNYAFDIPTKQEVTDEVSEYAGVLLVRLGGCSAMQVRLLAERDGVLVRIVPLAKATNLEDGSPWQAAADSQLRAWCHSNSAIWRWLLAKGIDEDKARLLAESVLAIQPPSNHPRLFALRSKNSMSLP